jgi:hypothetical protein
MAGVLEVIWGKREAEYFFEEGWTGPSTDWLMICPSGTVCRKATAISGGALQKRKLSSLRRTLIRAFGLFIVCIGGTLP